MRRKPRRAWGVSRGQSIKITATVAPKSPKRPPEAPAASTAVPPRTTCQAVLATPPAMAEAQKRPSETLEP